MDALSFGMLAAPTVSIDIQNLAFKLLARDRQPLTVLQTRLDDLNKESSVLGTLRTKLLAVHDEAQVLSQLGTLSPFAAMAATSSDTSVLTASATPTAAAGTFSVTVAQLAQRSTFATNTYTGAGTAISGANTGTFAFSLTIAGTTYNASVTVNAGDTDQTVLQNVATAINTAVGGAASAVVAQLSTGQARLSVASANTGTANQITFTDTNGLLGQLGLTNPAAATNTTGGYVFADLGNHELDAKVVVNGLTYFRGSNTITDLVSGVTLTLKSTSASPLTVQVAPDADAAVSEIKNFIQKYNDAIDYLRQNTVIDAQNNIRGPLAGDSTFLLLPSELRATEGTIVGSQPAGTPNSLAALGIQADDNGDLSITNEAQLRSTFTTNPSAVENLFNAPDGVATQLTAFVDRYSSFSGLIAADQNQLGLQVTDLKGRISDLQARLDTRQAALEQQLAQEQAMLDSLNNQSTQISRFLAGVSTG